MKTGLYIGRFQPFHNGHKLVVDTMLEEVDIAVICIGLSEEVEKNPYDYTTRLHFLTHIYSNKEHIYFFPLPDLPDDRAWVESIHDIPYIAQSDELTVYCGDKKHDSAVRVIKAYQEVFGVSKLKVQEISRDIIAVSATQVREQIQQSGVDTIKDFIPPEVLDILKA